MHTNRWINFIQETLDSFFPVPETSLLATEDPYTLLIAVLLSARCRDEQVNKVTPELFTLASTAEAMLNLSVEKIRSIIRPCGLSDSKANAIFNLSLQLVKNHKGRVPENFKDLEDLPGVGHKTASVVLGRAFGIHTFPIDTHIHRLAKRWHLTNGNTPVHTEKCLKNLFPENRWYTLHLQFIHYGRKFCNRHACNKHHLCTICQRIPEFLPTITTTRNPT